MFIQTGECVAEKRKDDPEIGSRDGGTDAEEGLRAVGQHRAAADGGDGMLRRGPHPPDGGEDQRRQIGDQSEQTLIHQKLKNMQRCIMKKYEK